MPPWSVEMWDIENKVECSNLLVVMLVVLSITMSVYSGFSYEYILPKFKGRYDELNNDGMLPGRGNRKGSKFTMSSSKKNCKKNAMRRKKNNKQRRRLNKTNYV